MKTNVGILEEDTIIVEIGTHLGKITSSIMHTGIGRGRTILTTSTSNFHPRTIAEQTTLKGLIIIQDLASG
jgi:hypothetical protein